MLNLHNYIKSYISIQLLMINRSLVRVKVVQTLYAYYQDGDKSFRQAEKELLNSFDDIYTLYMMELELINAITHFAELRLTDNIETARIRHENYTPRYNFIRNKFAKQVFENRTLRRITEEKQLSWDMAHHYLLHLYQEIIKSPLYEEYMALENTTYQQDKLLWRHIITKIVATENDFLDALEELEPYFDAKSWDSDGFEVLSYVIKTIKRFQEENGQEQPLLEMFDSEEELDFAKKLLRCSLEKAPEAKLLMEGSLKNWDESRLSYFDNIIIQAAVAELLCFPEIPIQVTLDEYLNIAHEYSSDKSPMFVNGLVAEIVAKLKKENKLIKAVGA